jgi:hypothetical protein
MRTFVIALLFSFTSLSPMASGQGTLVGHWPLESGPEDITGQMLPMKLENVPFQNGGVYCSGHVSSWVETPAFPQSLFQGFTVSIQFMVEDIPVTAHAMTPVLVGGTYYRWVGFELANNGTVSLLYNNSGSVHTAIGYTANVWHEATMSYDAASSMRRIYLNGAFVAEYQGDLIHGDTESDWSFLNQNRGNGSSFKGHLRNLKIWLGSPVTTVHQGIRPDANISLDQNHPNPVSGYTTLRFTLSQPAHAELDIHNTLGEKIATLRSGYFEAGEHAATWSTAPYPPGTYFYRLRVGDRAVTRMMQVVK